MCLSLRGWDWRVDEGAEVAELAAGLIESGRVDVCLLDGLRPRDAEVREGELEPGAPRSRWWFLRHRPDVLVVFFPLPVVQIVAAVVMRAFGSRVLLVPMAWLGRDFVSASWFRSGSTLRLRGKAWVGRVVRQLWLNVADLFVCASDHERRQAELPLPRCVLVPLATPVTPLVEALVEGSLDLRRDTTPPEARPVALVTRFDVYRKGIDRVCAWLDAYRDELPRPAVVLLAPPDDDPPAEVVRLCTDGLIEWDQRSSGADLAGPLGRCRAVILLTRYEGYPRVLREAALAGLPIITTASANFAETLELLSTPERQAGYIVDGDDARKVQAAFGALEDSPPDGQHRAWRVLDRRRIGSYLAEVTLAAAEGRTPDETSYYRWASRQAAADSGGS